MNIKHTLLMLCIMTTGNVYSAEWLRTGVNTIRVWLHLQPAIPQTPEVAQLRSLINNQTTQNDYFKALDDAQELLNNNKTQNQRFKEELKGFWKYRTEQEGDRKAQETQQTASILTSLTPEERHLRSQLKSIEKMKFQKALYLQMLSLERGKTAGQRIAEKHFWKYRNQNTEDQKVTKTRAAWDNFVDDQVLKGGWGFKYSNGYSAHDHLKDRILDLKEEYRVKLRDLLGNSTPNQEFISAARVKASSKNADLKSTQAGHNKASLYDQQIDLENQNSDLKKLRRKIELARTIVAQPTVSDSTQQSRENRKKRLQDQRNESIYRPASAATATDSND